MFKTIVGKLIQGIPPTTSAAAAGSTSYEYRSATQLTRDEIHGADVLEWEEWRVDPDGEQWYRRKVES